MHSGPILAMWEDEEVVIKSFFDMHKERDLNDWTGK